MLEMYDATYKVMLLGDEGVGKKTFGQAFLNKLFKEDTKMTIGVDFEFKSLEINGKKIKLQVWYVGGKRFFWSVLPMYVRGANGVLILYDVTNYSSLASIDEFLSIIRKEMKSEQDTFPIVVVGNKADLEDAREITGEEGLEFAKSRGVDGFIECSAKTGEHVEEAFDGLTRLMMQRSGLI
ncbi:MAG: Rab family GTPase [Candidatus Hodarchaeota archaeon]